MSYLLRKIAFDKCADDAMNKAEQGHIDKGTEAPKKTIGDKISDVAKPVGDFAGDLWTDVKGWAQRAGKNISDNKYAYSGGVIGAAAGVPVGLGIAELTGMSATEKVLTTILSSSVLAAAGARVGHKYDGGNPSSTGGKTNNPNSGMTATASYKCAADEEASAGSKAYEKLKSGATGVWDHIYRNKGKYTGGAIGLATAVPLGATIAESFGMRPTEKLITMIATGIATFGSGLVIGDYMDSKA